MTAPDFLPDLKSWLKTNATLNPLHGGRVFFRVPDKPSAYPLLRIYQASGGVQRGGDFQVLYDRRIGIEVWASAPPAGFKQYDAVRQLTLAIEGVLNDAPGQPLGSNSYMANAWVTASVDNPDPETGSPRFVMDAVITVRNLGSADAA